MRTQQELAEWCVGAIAKFGDPAEPVGQIFAHYQRLTEVAALKAPPDDLLVCTFEANTLSLHIDPECAIPLRVDMAGPVFDGDRLQVFGIELISRGLWALKPSLYIPNTFHAFVVVYDAPDPAPWQKLIVWG